MKIRAKNGGQTVDITLPATDMDMQYCMKCIGIEDIVPVCCISEVWDEPSYFGFLKGQTVSMDELNFLARRLDGMTEYEKRVVGVYSSETGIREMKQLINLTYSLQGLSLLTDLTDGNRVGLRLYLDRHLAISEEEKSKMDFNAYAQKIFSEGKCKFLPHGILVDQGFQMEEVYNGKTFPEYIDRPDETVSVLSLENEAGDKEYLYLPTDISAMDKVKKRLNIAAFAEGIVNGIENIRLPESILPSPEDMCMSLQGDVQKLTLFNEMCQTVSCFDEAKWTGLQWRQDSWGQVNLLISLTSQSIWMNLKYIRRYIRIKSMGNFWLKKRGCLKLMNFSCRILIMPGLPVIKDRQRWQTADLFQRALLARRGRSMSIRNIRGNLPICLKKTGYPVKRSAFTVRWQG